MKQYIVATFISGVIELEGREYLENVVKIVAEDENDAERKHVKKFGRDYFFPRVVGVVENDDFRFYDRYKNCIVTPRFNMRQKVSERGLKCIQNVR